MGWLDRAMCQAKGVPVVRTVEGEGGGVEEGGGEGKCGVGGVGLKPDLRVVVQKISLVNIFRVGSSLAVSCNSSVTVNPAFMNRFSEA